MKPAALTGGDTRPFARPTPEIPLPDDDMYAAHLPLIQTQMDAVRAGNVDAVAFNDLAATTDGPISWAARNTPVVMTGAFHTQWDDLAESDRQSALVRLTAINRDTWHPSLVIAQHTRRVMSATSSTGAVLFFTRYQGGFAFLSVAPGQVPPAQT